MVLARTHSVNRPRPANGKDQRQRRHPGPAFDRIHQQARNQYQREIVIEQPAIFAAAPHQKRCRRGADNADRRQQRAVKPAQHHRQRRHGDQPDQRHLRPDQPIHLPRGQHTGKQRHQPRTGKGRGQIGRMAVLVPCPPADPFPRRDQGNAQGKRPHHPPERGQIAVFNAVLHEKHPRQRHRKRGNGQKPVRLQPTQQGGRFIAVEHKGAGLGRFRNRYGFRNKIGVVCFARLPRDTFRGHILDRYRPLLRHFFRSGLGGIWRHGDNFGHVPGLQAVHTAFQLGHLFLQLQMAEQQIKRQ